jgi:hypothetical protein
VSEDGGESVTIPLRDELDVHAEDWDDSASEDCGSDGGGFAEASVSTEPALPGDAGGALFEATAGCNGRIINYYTCGNRCSRNRRRWVQHRYCRTRTGTMYKIRTRSRCQHYCGGSL